MHDNFLVKKFEDISINKLWPHRRTRLDVKERKTESPGEREMFILQKSCMS